MLDLYDHPDKAGDIAVIPQNEKDAVLSYCDNDGPDMEYEGETDHVPARLLMHMLNLCKQIMTGPTLAVMRTASPPLQIIKIQGPLQKIQEGLARRSKCKAAGGQK